MEVVQGSRCSGFNWLNAYKFKTTLEKKLSSKLLVVKIAQSRTVSAQKKKTIAISCANEMSRRQRIFPPKR